MNMSLIKIPRIFTIPLYICFFVFAVQAQDPNQLNTKIEGQWESLGLACNIGGPGTDLHTLSVESSGDLMDNFVNFMTKSITYAQTTLHIQSDGNWSRQVDIGSIIPGILSMIGRGSDNPDLNSVNPSVIFSLLFNLKVPGESCILQERGTYSWHEVDQKWIMREPQDYSALRFKSEGLEADLSACLKDFIQTLEKNAQAVLTPNQAQIFVQHITPAINDSSFPTILSQAPAHPTQQYEWLVNTSQETTTQLHTDVGKSAKSFYLDTCSNKLEPSFIRYTRSP